MALILSVSVGEDIHIAGQVIYVEMIYGDGNCTLRVRDEIVAVGDRRSIEIFPEVMVSAGRLGKNPRYIQLNFRAPRDIDIERGRRLRGEIDASA